MFNKVIIIGVGQIGASIGMNLVARRLAKEVVGVGRHPKNLREAMRRKAIHRVGTIRTEGATRRGELSDLIILATPVRTIRDLLKKMPKGSLIIDVGSTKSSIVKEARSHGLRFIGCHPIAGTERGGVQAGSKELFRGRMCVVTPSRGSSKKDLKGVLDLWTRLGSKVVLMSPEQHDRLFATTSHLPHISAYSLALAAAKLIPLSKNRRFLFTSLKDATRVAASPPEMWRDIFLENRPFVLAAIDRYVGEIRKLRSHLARKDAAALFRMLSDAQKIRLGFGA